MAPFASLARGLAALILVTLYSEMSANRQEFQEDDWTFYIISAGICAFLAARAPRPTARRRRPRASPPPRAPRRAARAPRRRRRAFRRRTASARTTSRTRSRRPSGPRPSR